MRWWRWRAPERPDAPRPRRARRAPLLLSRHHQDPRLSGRRPPVLSRRPVHGRALSDRGLCGRGRRGGPPPAGVYHFSPGTSPSAGCSGRLPGALAVAGADDGIADRQATVILTAIYWRNTCKYQARGYRHLFWDSGASSPISSPSPLRSARPPGSSPASSSATSMASSASTSRRKARSSWPRRSRGRECRHLPAGRPSRPRGGPALLQGSGLPGAARRLPQLQPRLRSRGARLARITSRRTADHSGPRPGPRLLPSPSCAAAAVARGHGHAPRIHAPVLGRADQRGAALHGSLPCDARLAGGCARRIRGAVRQCPFG